MVIVSAIILFSCIIGLVVVGILNKSETQIPTYIYKITSIILLLLTYLFPYAFTNVFSSYFLCIFSRNPENNPTYPSSFSSSEGTNSSFMIFLSIAFLVFLFLLCVLVRMFVIHFFTREYSLFSCYSGFYPALQFVFIFILLVISPILKNFPFISSIVGTVLFFLLFIYPLAYQPYFNSAGNAISSALFSAAFVTFFFSIFLVFIKKSFVVYDDLPSNLKSTNNLPVPLFAVILIWVIYCLFMIVVPIIVYKITYKKSQGKWAMGKDDPIPSSKKGKNENQLRIVSPSSGNSNFSVLPNANLLLTSPVGSIPTGFSSDTAPLIQDQSSFLV
jgi:hypothetical protein